MPIASNPERGVTGVRETLPFVKVPELLVSCQYSEELIAHRPVPAEPTVEPEKTCAVITGEVPETLFSAKG